MIIENIISKYKKVLRMEDWDVYAMPVGPDHGCHPRNVDDKLFMPHMYSSYNKYFQVLFLYIANDVKFDNERQKYNLVLYHLIFALLYHRFACIFDKYAYEIDLSNSFFHRLSIMLSGIIQNKIEIPICEDPDMGHLNHVADLIAQMLYFNHYDIEIEIVDNLDCNGKTTVTCLSQVNHYIHIELCSEIDGLSKERILCHEIMHHFVDLHLRHDLTTLLKAGDQYVDERVLISMSESLTETLARIFVPE